MTEQEERELIGRWWDFHAQSERADLDEFYATPNASHRGGALTGPGASRMNTQHRGEE